MKYLRKQLRNWLLSKTKKIIPLNRGGLFFSLSSELGVGKLTGVA
jgi:hypothetical protein